MQVWMTWGRVNDDRMMVLSWRLNRSPWKLTVQSSEQDAMRRSLNGSHLTSSTRALWPHTRGCRGLTRPVWNTHNTHWHTHPGPEQACGVGSKGVWPYMTDRNDNEGPASCTLCHHGDESWIDSTELVVLDAACDWQPTVAPPLNRRLPDHMMKRHTGVTLGHLKTHTHTHNETGCVCGWGSGAVLKYSSCRSALWFCSSQCVFGRNNDVLAEDQRHIKDFSSSWIIENPTNLEDESLMLQGDCFTSCYKTKHLTFNLKPFSRSHNFLHHDTRISGQSKLKSVSMTPSVSRWTHIIQSTEPKHCSAFSTIITSAFKPVRLKIQLNEI